MHKELLIVGNGFDLAHGLKVSYADFRDYLEKTNFDFLLRFEKMYGIYTDFLYESHIHSEELQRDYKSKIIDILWKDFELEIGYPNFTEMEELSDVIVSNLGLETGSIYINDTMDIYWKEMYGFSNDLNKLTKEWISTITTKHIHPKKKSLVNNNEYICFSFNYTDTLEQVYHLENIKHIHGAVDSVFASDSDLIIGHGNYSKIDEYKDLSKKAFELMDEGKCSIYTAIVRYLESIFKDTNRIIFMNKGFFEKLKEVEKITIIGWSAGKVDLPYLKEISKYVRSYVTWTIYWYDDESKCSLINALDSLGVSKDKVIFKHSNEFWD